MRETYRFTDVVCTICGKSGNELLSREDQPERRCSCGGERLRADSAPVGAAMIGGEFKVIHPDGAQYGHVTLNECRDILAGQGKVVSTVEYIDRASGVRAEEKRHDNILFTAKRFGISTSDAERLGRGEAPGLAHQIQETRRQHLRR